MLLGVNIDHIATLRQARYAGNPTAPIVEPSVLEAANVCQKAGADSLTIHVREDGRHMQRVDAFELKEKVDLPLNLDMANTGEMLKFALELNPDFVCLVPESRDEVTTEGGLDVVGQETFLEATIAELQKNGIKVSLFIDPEPDQIEAAGRLGAEMVELHTGGFAQFLGKQRNDELERLKLGAVQAYDALDLQVNAGHGLHYDNLQEFLEVPHLTELNIGHAIIARAVFVGLEQAVREMRALIDRMAG